MTQEFVPYEQALKLKELGFDEPCFFAFDNCSTPMRCTDLRTNEQKFNGVNYNSSSYTSQPTFSQAFRWFREKYKMAIINPDWNNKFNYKIFNLHLLNEGILTEKSGFETYEEAELACLNKLIEIVESNTKEK